MMQALISQLVVIMLLAGAGYLARKLDIINQKVQLGLSAIVLNIAIPCSILSSANKPYDPAHLGSILGIVIGAVIYYVGCILIFTLLTKVIRLPKAQGTIFTLLAMFANVAFIGYPIISIFLPDSGVFFASFYVLVFNVFFFTYATAKTSGKAKLSPAAIFGNINTIAAALMIVLYVVQVRLPAPLQTTLELLGNLATPLSMLVIGSMLATIKIRQLFATPLLYLLSFLRLLLIPLITFGALKLLGISGTVATVLLIMSALPSASMTVMVAEQNKFEPEFATKGVLLSTILFVFTLPVVAVLHGFL